MKIKLSELKKIIKEAQWGAFTGGAAPLDEPPLDSGQMDPDQQQKVFDILVDTGSDPKQLKASGKFPDVVVEIKLKLSELRQIIHETVDDWYSDEHETLADKKYADGLGQEQDDWESDRLASDDWEMQQMGRDLYNRWTSSSAGDMSADEFLERHLTGMRDMGSIEDEEDYAKREKLIRQGFDTHHSERRRKRRR